MNRNIEALWEAIATQATLIQSLRNELQELREQLTNLRY